MKKLFSLIFATIILVIPLQSSLATSVVHITVEPGWNTFSTPQKLSAISFSNGGEGLSFFTLEAGNWSDTTVDPTPENIKPLKGFLVFNDNSEAVKISLTFQATEMDDLLHQKTLDSGWNVIGIAHNAYQANPLRYTAVTGGQALDYFHDTGYASVVDFTSTDFTDSGTPTNTADQVNTITSAEADTAYFQEFKAYAIFINEDNTVYGGTQGTVDNTTLHLYAEASGQNAFDLTDKFADIEFQVFDFGNFITGINGLAGDESHFWSFSVNDAFSQVGANDVTLDEGDKISWTYTGF